MAIYRKNYHNSWQWLQIKFYFQGTNLILLTKILPEFNNMKTIKTAKKENKAGRKTQSDLGLNSSSATYCLFYLDQIT